MKPLKLEFKGINSFSEHTIIDFEALTRSGLFGIFGDTGSGKSTILDCINFALYGSVERSKEKTDIINYRCDTAYVKFVFTILNEGKRKSYTVERTLKKDKYGTHKASLYERDGEDEVCIADKTSTVERKIVEILGVEAEDFRKCIALPQGEFSQFVKSAPRDRLALIERLFSLSKYGDRLKEKLSARQNETEGLYQNISGRLQAYEEVTESALNQAYMGVNLKIALLEEQNKKAKEATKKCEELKKLYEKHLELEETERNLAEMYAKQGEIEKLRKDFSALSICKEVVKINYEKSAKLNDILGVIEKIKGLESEISEKAKELFTLESSIKDSNFDDEIAQCVRLGALYQSSDGQRQKLETLGKELNLKRIEYRNKEEEKRAIENELKTAQAELSEAQKQFDNLSGENFDGILNTKFKGALLKEEYAHNLDYFATLNGNIKVYKDDSLLYKYVSGELNEKIKEYTQRILDVNDFSIQDVNEQLESIQRIEKEKELKRKTLSACTEKVQKLSAALEIKESELKASLKEGADLKARSDEIRAEILKVFGSDCADFNEVILSNDKKLNSLKHRKEQLSVSLEKTRNAKNELELNLEKQRTLRQALETEVKNLDKKLESYVESSHQGSVEGCISLAARFDGVGDAERILKEFDDRLSILSHAAETLKKIDGIATATEDEYRASECEKSNILAGISQLSGEIAVLKRECDTLEKRLKEKGEIEEEYNRIEKQRTLLARLKEVTKNNKFMEFIANEYLCDVSSLASSTLLKLKDGRYFLSYKDNNFYVGDNFDCGNLRGVNTLSGGETFLVSLSLALALSQTICAKSMKSIEFFFLDEGFGTLDSTLVETVMNALYKLKSSDFTIGIISHVEELKNAIDSKITVIKATETHGSTVKISC